MGRACPRSGSGETGTNWVLVRLGGKSRKHNRVTGRVFPCSGEAVTIWLTWTQPRFG